MEQVVNEEDVQAPFEMLSDHLKHHMLKHRELYTLDEDKIHDDEEIKRKKVKQRESLKNFQCNICNKRFAHNSDFRRHTNISALRSKRI